MSQNNPPIIYAGLDIHKATLQLHLQNQGHDLPNSAPGHRRLLALLRAAEQPVHLLGRSLRRL